MPEQEKTQSDQQLLREIRDTLMHLLEDVHEQGSRLARIEARANRADLLLTEFEPIIRLYATPVSAVVATRRARKQRREAPANG
jgi:hypothetical protein